ncbi:MAG: DUF455 domain-containing protein, partial [Bradymonadaceae bacterium]|nr:DUF455 domain-containing protein [Lujinxingiaceae bacterium]
MELREFAQRLLHADTLEGKFYVPEGGVITLSDHSPGEAMAWSAPARPVELQIATKSERRRKRLPHPDTLGQPEMAVRVLHAFANHELM